MLNYDTIVSIAVHMFLSVKGTFTYEHLQSRIDLESYLTSDRRTKFEWEASLSIATN